MIVSCVFKMHFEAVYTISLRMLIYLIKRLWVVFNMHFEASSLLTRGDIKLLANGTEFVIDVTVACPATRHMTRTASYGHGTRSCRWICTNVQ